MNAAKQTYINTQEASLRLSRWMHYVPIVIFAEWRVDALYEIIMILSGQTLNRSRGGQNIHAKVKKALSKGGQWKPTRNEFRAFWLNWGAQLKLEWLELLHRHGWDDLMDWSSDGPGMVDVSHLGNYNLMAEADSVAQRSQLTFQQAKFRGHILAMKVLSVDHGRMQIEFPYELDTDFETLVKSIEAYTPAPEQVDADAMSLDGSDEDFGQCGDSRSRAGTTNKAARVVDNLTRQRGATMPPGTQDNIGAPDIVNAASTAAAGPIRRTAAIMETQPMTNRPQLSREASPDTETRINAALASLGRQMKQLKRKHSDDILSIKRKHDEDIAALSRKHDEDIAAQNQMHGDDMANVKQDIDELRAKNAMLRGGVLTSKRPAKEQLKNTVDAILEQEVE